MTHAEGGGGIISSVRRRDLCRDADTARSTPRSLLDQPHQLSLRRSQELSHGAAAASGYARALLMSKDIFDGLTTDQQKVVTPSGSSSSVRPRLRQGDEKLARSTAGRGHGRHEPAVLAKWAQSPRRRVDRLAARNAECARLLNWRRRSGFDPHCGRRKTVRTADGPNAAAGRVARHHDRLNASSSR